MQYTKDKKIERMARVARWIYAWIGFVAIILAVPAIVYIIITL